MARENSFSDSDGRSLTPDLEDENDFDAPASPVSITASPVQNSINKHDSPGGSGSGSGEGNLNNSLQASQTPTLAPSPVHPARPAVVFDDNVLSKAVSAPTSIPAHEDTLRSIDTAGPTRSVSSDAALSPLSTPPKRPSPALERFRTSAKKVIQLKRTSGAISSLVGVGAEPGIDPRRSYAFLTYGHIKSKCNIELADYSAVRSSFGKMENKGIIEFLKNPRASEREPWVKVRWINIGGISWDVLSAVALKYDIHPLALEDILHNRSQARSKADYYVKHLFIRVLRHSLAPEESEELAVAENRYVDMPRSQSPVDLTTEESDPEDEKTLAGSRFFGRRPSTFNSIRGAMSQSAPDLEAPQEESPPKRASTSSSLLMRRKQFAERLSIEELKKGERVNVDVNPFYIFLFRDGTVISINPTNDLSFTLPIMSRLRKRETGLRATADPSLLVESLLDLIVDQALEVTDEYHRKILKLERDVLIKPNIKTVRYLHIMSGDLTMQKRTLEPIKTLVYGLRRYDVDRCAALITSSGMNVTKVEGFMSHKSKIYLADVHDHMDYVISSLDMFSSIAENLINYTFNTASYQMNEVMRILTMTTVVFLPLTLLTGYFGMNFVKFWSINNNSDLFFWKIALPVMAVIIPLFLWSDIMRMVHYIRKRWAVRRVFRLAKAKTL